LLFRFYCSISVPLLYIGFYIERQVNTIAAISWQEEKKLHLYIRWWWWCHVGL